MTAICATAHSHEEHGLQYQWTLPVYRHEVLLQVCLIFGMIALFVTAKVLAGVFKGKLQ